MQDIKCNCYPSGIRFTDKLKWNWEVCTKCVNGVKKISTYEKTQRVLDGIEKENEIIKGDHHENNA